MLCDESAHHLNAFGIIEDNQLHSGFREQVLGSEKVPVLGDHHNGNAEQERCSRTHYTWAKSAYQRELIPIATPSGIADAYHFGMRGGISGLYTQIVATRDYAAGAVGQHGTYG
jgi:hypothetical protein